MSDTAAFTWERRVNLYTDRFMLRDMARVGALSIAMMWVLVALMGVFVLAEPVLLPPVVLLVVACILLVLYFLAVLLMGVSVPMGFALDESGAHWSTGKRVARLSRIATVVGVLAGNPTAAGAGMLGMARESGTVPWEDVVVVRPFSHAKVIELADGWHTLLRLYCTAETYEIVLAYARQHATGEATRLRPFVRPQQRDITALGIAFVSAVGVASWEWAVYSVREAALLALAVLAVLAAGVLRGGARRAMGFITLVSSGFLAARIVVEAVDPITMVSTGEVIGHGWELDTPQLAVAILGVLVLAGIGATLAFRKR